MWRYGERSPQMSQASRPGKLDFPIATCRIAHGRSLWQHPTAPPNSAHPSFAVIVGVRYGISGNGAHTQTELATSPIPTRRNHTTALLPNQAPWRELANIAASSGIQERARRVQLGQFCKNPKRGRGGGTSSILYPGRSISRIANEFPQNAAPYHSSIPYINSIRKGVSHVGQDGGAAAPISLKHN